jgi:hypothetical protein
MKLSGERGTLTVSSFVQQSLDHGSPLPTRNAAAGIKQRGVQVVPGATLWRFE